MRACCSTSGCPACSLNRSPLHGPPRSVLGSATWCLQAVQAVVRQFPGFHVPWKSPGLPKAKQSQPPVTVTNYRTGPSSVRLKLLNIPLTRQGNGSHALSLFTSPHEQRLHWYASRQDVEEHSIILLHIPHTRPMPQPWPRTLSQADAQFNERTVTRRSPRLGPRYRPERAATNAHIEYPPEATSLTTIGRKLSGVHLKRTSGLSFIQ